MRLLNIILLLGFFSISAQAAVTKDSDALVTLDGSGTHPTIQAAIDAVPADIPPRGHSSTNCLGRSLWLL